MAVGFDAVSESHTGTTGSTSQASFQWNHTPAGTPRGVLVFVFSNASTNYATSVTYGGTTVPAVSGGSATCSSAEAGACAAYFLGSGLGTGTKTVVVNRTNNATVMYAVAITVTADNDTKIGGTPVTQSGGTGTLALSEQNVDDGSPGTNSMRFMGCNSGLSTVPNVGANSASMGASAYIDYGQRVAFTAREATAGQGSRPVGVTASADDVAAVYVAVSEFPRLTSSLTVTASGAAALIASLANRSGTGQPTIVGEGYAATDGGGQDELIVSVTGTVRADDLMIAVWALDSGSMTAPSGWTDISGLGDTVGMMWKRVGSSNDPVTFSFGLGDACAVRIFVISYAEDPPAMSGVGAGTGTSGTVSAPTAGTNPTVAFYIWNALGSAYLHEWTGADATESTQLNGIGSLNNISLGVARLISGTPTSQAWTTNATVAWVHGALGIDATYPLASGLTSSLSVAATGSGALATKVKAASTLSGSATLAAALTSRVRLVKAFDVSATGAAALSTRVRLTSSLSVAATGAVALSTRVKPTTSLAVSATLSAALVTRIRLVRALDVSATGAATLNTRVRLVSSLAASATGAAGLTSRVRLAQTLTVVASGAASLTTTSSGMRASLSATASGAVVLSTAVKLAGALSVAATGSATLRVPLHLGAVLSGASTGVAVLSTRIRAVASLSGAATGAGALSTVVSPRSALAVVASGAASATTRVKLAGALAGAATGAAALTTSGTMRASLEVAATGAAVLHTAPALHAALTVSATGAAALATAVKLRASLSSAATLAAALVTRVRLVSAMAVDATLAASLTTTVSPRSALTATGSGATALITRVKLAAAPTGVAGGSVVVIVLPAIRPFVALDIRKVLVDAGVIAEARVFIGEMPTALPAVVVTEIQGDRAVRLGDGRVFEQPAVAVDVVASSYDEARTLAEAAYRALLDVTNRYVGSVFYAEVLPVPPSHVPSPIHGYVVSRVEAMCVKELAA